MPLTTTGRRMMFALVLLSFCIPARLAVAQTSAPDMPASPTGPADKAPHFISPPVAARPPHEMVGSSVYIYSFLDVREAQYSPGLLDEINKQFSKFLTSSGVNFQLLKFRDSPVGMGLSQETNIPMRWGRFETSENVPVATTISSNQDAEKTFEAKYRLIEFPANFTTEGAWRFFTIRFILIDCTDNKVLMDYHYDGRTLIWLMNGERPESRAKAIVGGISAALKGGGFL